MYLKGFGIPTMIYYPLPLYQQKAYSSKEKLPVTEMLCNEVLSIPIHTEMNEEKLQFISDKIHSFFN